MLRLRLRFKPAFRRCDTPGLLSVAIKAIRVGKWNSRT